MPIQITINAMTGSSPYDVYLCDIQLVNCFYIETITNLPYVFDIPPPMNNQSSACVKIVDNLNCVTYTCQNF
jgi:hypothetical protein